MGHFWNESYASIYPMLKRLLQRGLVERQQVEQTDKPDKWVYSITDEGKMALQAWLSEEVTPAPPRNILLLKIFFGAHVHDEELVGHVLSYRRELMDELSKNEIRISQIRNNAENEDSVYQLLTLSHSIHNTRAMLAWCKRALELLT